MLIILQKMNRLRRFTALNRSGRMLQWFPITAFPNAITPDRYFIFLFALILYINQPCGKAFIGL